MAHSLQEEASLSLSCPPGDALASAFKPCLLGVCDLAALTATWPMAEQAPEGSLK